MSVDNKPIETPSQEEVENFRDVGKTINTIMGSDVMIEGRLFRGGAIDHCSRPSSIGEPDLIVCLRTQIDRCDWSKIIHSPKPNDLECYATEETRIQQWLLIAILGVVEARNAEKIYVHCRLGRDRTGVVIAAYLMMIGIPKWAIIYDYLISNGAKLGEILRAISKLDSVRTRLPNHVVPVLQSRWLLADFR